MADRRCIEQGLAVGMLRGRALLAIYEDIGRYVFHGSPSRFGVLRPNQGYILNRVSGEPVADGAPSISATTEADIAIFVALVSTKRQDVGPCRMGFNRSGGDPKFRATRNLLEAARRDDSVGYVYVLQRSYFAPHRGSELRATQSILPYTVVSVRPDDLPPEISIIEIDEP